jgi:hypothetical protein
MPSISTSCAQSADIDSKRAEKKSKILFILFDFKLLICLGINIKSVNRLIRTKGTAIPTPHINTTHANAGV